jgi:hypothetical protein
MDRQGWLIINRSSLWKRFNGVGESGQDMFDGIGVGVYGQHCIHRSIDAPEIVDSMQMISMRVCVYNGVKPKDIGPQQLFAQVRRGVYEYSFGSSFKQY